MKYHNIVKLFIGNGARWDPIKPPKPAGWRSAGDETSQDEDTDDFSREDFHSGFQLCNFFHNFDHNKSLFLSCPILMSKS